MKLRLATTFLCLLAPVVTADEAKTPEQQIASHRDGSSKVADEQDELSADVQQLVIEQTVPKVIEFLHKAENIMDEVTDRLAEANTGGETIAAQTEIIEMILAAAEQKQSQGSGSKSGGAMMDMMKRMAGKKPGEGKEGEGEGEGKGKGEKGGKGQTGSSDTGNEAVNGDASGKSEIRRIPKASGNSNLELPEEFKKAFDAYNRGAEKMVK